jgi:hypothetical protein
MGKAKALIVGAGMLFVMVYLGFSSLRFGQVGPMGLSQALSQANLAVHGQLVGSFAMQSDKLTMIAWPVKDGVYGWVGFSRNSAQPVTTFVQEVCGGNIASCATMSDLVNHLLSKGWTMLSSPTEVDSKIVQGLAQAASWLGVVQWVGMSDATFIFLPAGSMYELLPPSAMKVQS